MGSRREKNQNIVDTKNTHQLKKKDHKSTLNPLGSFKDHRERGRSPSYVSLYNESEMIVNDKDIKPQNQNAVLTQSMYIDPNDVSNFNVSLAQKISTIMPQEIQSSFVLYPRKNEYGLKLVVNDKFWNTIDQQDKNTKDAIYASEFRQYDGQKLFDKVRSQTLSHGKVARFYDDFFPPTIGSLVPNTTIKKLNPSWQQLKWVRLADLYKNFKMVLAEKNSTPNDVLSGYFGDNYLANTLSAVAELPQIVEKIFSVSKDVNSQGIYCVNFFDNGVKTEIIIDDYIPCFEMEPGVLEPAFAQPRVNTEMKTIDIWVHLVIKAWAKLNGCYYNIIRGTVEEFYTDITG